MSRLINLITGKSVRRQYLLLALCMALVVMSYTWYTGVWVERTAQTSISHIEQRITAADLNNRIRRAVISADNALDLFLLSPAEHSRAEFYAELRSAELSVNELQASAWASESAILQELRGMPPLLNSMHSAGNQIMNVRQTANLMYPAMRLANGEMLEANRDMLTQADAAIAFYARHKNLSSLQRDVWMRLVEARDAWLRTIISYRLFIINRTGSLYEHVLQNQIDDVNLHYKKALSALRELTELNRQQRLDLEVSHAIEEMQSQAPHWYKGFEEVVRIDREGIWRGDISLINDVINPLFHELYEILDKVDNELKQTSNIDLVEQTQISRSIIHSLWGMALFVLLVAVISLIVLEVNFIRPIARVARSLKAEAQGHDTYDLPDVKATEIRDLTDAFQELRQQVHTRQLALEHIAMHDSLTSLPNRALLMDRLNQSIVSAQRRKRSLALLMLDLDRFKEINDTLGHQTGDALLQQVGARLRNVLRDSDTVARLGGDEFAVLLPNVNDTNALRIAGAIHEKLEKVYEVYEHSLYVGVSIGIAVFPQHGETAEILLQHADVAMYMAKRANSGMTVYDVDRDEHSVSHLSVLSDLRSAVENEEFILQYQPTLSMRDSKIAGAEALIRWRHPRQGLIMPEEFINVAEQTGLIKRISNWVLDTAIRDCHLLHKKGHKLKMSVNLSVWDIQDPNIGANITRKLEKWGLSANYLTLEITERVMMAEPERARQVLTELDNMGVQVVIDDFGTGFSSLVYLKQLPVSMLKVDKSFVIDMMKDDSDAAIVHSIVELAHNLGLETVAEGVENDQTWSWLRTWDCDYAQGYYISHPLSFIEFEHYLETYEVHNVIG